MAAGAYLAAMLGISTFAERCPACAGRSVGGFCAGCTRDLVRVRRPCGRCALPLPVRRCPRADGGWLLDAVFAPFEYTSPLDHYLQALKFGRGRSLGRPLGLLLARSLASADACGLHDAQLVVPVPLHRRRLLARGFNQASEIARPLAAELGVRLDEAAARRVLEHVPQSRLSASARRANVARAFRAARHLDGSRIVIVDDVITTGATANALAAALLAAGAERVSALAVARTAPPGLSAQAAGTGVPAPSR